MDKKTRKILHFLIVILFLAAGVLGMAKLTSLKPQIKKRRPPTPLPTVRTIKVKSRTVQIVIKGEGVVYPVQKIQLVPQVGGKVVYISPAMVNGGTFEKGEVLLQIDPEDYKLAVILARSTIKEAQSKLQMAQEDSAAAKEEWRLHYGTDSKIMENPPPLVAKEPQLKSAQARLEAAMAELKKTELNLKRTELEAPFSGLVTEKWVDIGQYVTPGAKLATLYSTDSAEIVIPLEKKDLQWFHVPGFSPGAGPGSQALVKGSIAGKKIRLRGEVVRTEGKMDERTRMIHVVVQVKDPYAYKPPLAFGLFVHLEIKGQVLKNSVILPRSALHQDNGRENIVWIVNKDGLLIFRRVKIARFSDDRVIIRSGLTSNEMIAISPLKVVTNGMRVRNFPAKMESRL